MSKQNKKTAEPLAPNAFTVQYPGLPRKTIVAPVRESAIAQYRADYRISHTRGDDQFITSPVIEIPRVKR